MAVFFLWACAPPTPPSLPPQAPPKPPKPRPVLERLVPEEYPDFSDKMAFNGLDEALGRSLDYLKKLPPNRPVRFGGDIYAVSHVQHSLEVFLALVAERPSGNRLNTVIAERYIIYRSVGREATGDALYTGYYEPMIEGRRIPSKAFGVPLHSRPSDLLDIDLSLFAPDLKGRRIIGRQAGQTVVPYLDRGQIRQQTDFDVLAPPIVWVRDKIDRFILQIQGSGRIDLGDGSFLSAQYDSSNGLAYRSVGRLLIDSGKISAEDMSMQAIRTYLQHHPNEQSAIMDHNPRYIFFHEGAGPPLGALGVPLTPMRSIAVDRRIIPSAALAFITTELADVDESGTITGWAPYNGFASTQDTGSAIIGPGRVDLFCGHGVRAEVRAGHLKHPGQLYFLILKQTGK